MSKNDPFWKSITYLPNYSWHYELFKMLQYVWTQRSYINMMLSVLKAYFVQPVLDITKGKNLSHGKRRAT